MSESAAPPPSARIALWILIALAGLAPWPFGSTPPWAVHALTLIALATALAVSLTQARRGAITVPRAPLWPVAILVALGFIQLVPLPASVHAWLAPGSAALWHPDEPAASLVLTARARPISVYPAATSAWLATTGALIALALVAAPALGRRRTTMTVTWTLVGAGTLVAVYGVVARTVFGPLLYGHIAVPTVSPFGPFVNKNHFAGYVEMPALLGLGLGRGLWRQQAKASDGGTPSPSPAALIAFGASVTMMMAVLLSLSRGGALGVVSGVAVLAIVDYVTARHRGALGKVVAPIGLAAVLVLIVAFLPGEVHERLLGIARRDDQSTLYRLAIWKDSLRAWIASPLLGQGLGAFGDVIPRFKTTAGLFRVEHPENEPLEIAVEGGLLALAAAGSALTLLFIRSVRAIRGHRDRVFRGMVTGALAGMVALTVHGLVDFNLRSPSNATMFVALAALAAAPLGTMARPGSRRWLFVAALVAIAIVPAGFPAPWAILRDAHGSATKATRSAPESAALRVSLTERRSGEYLQRRPADPEGWLLASWTMAARGRAADAAAVARYAATLDPSNPQLLEQAKTIMARSAP